MGEKIFPLHTTTKTIILVDSPSVVTGNSHEYSVWCAGALVEAEPPVMGRDVVFLV